MDRKKLKTFTLITAAFLMFLTLPGTSKAQSEDLVEIKSIDKTVKGNTVSFKVTLRSEYGAHGILKAQSQSTGYKSLEVQLSESQDETYHLSGFEMTKDKETFKITFSNQNQTMAQEYIQVTASNGSGGAGGTGSLTGFIINNLLFIAGVVILTLIGVIFITPFIQHEKGNKPFESDVSLEDIKKGKEK